MNNAIVKDQKISFLHFLKANLTIFLYSLKNRFSRSKNSHLKYTKFHSQCGEDRYIFTYLNPPEKGVFVDVGAGHPISLSNTYFFEQNGWNGICIDADPERCEVLKKARKTVECAAISSQDGEIDFSRSYLPDLSRTSGKEEQVGIFKLLLKEPIKVYSCKLETLLEKYQIGKIDLLSIDVEGSEIDVWQTFDYVKHQPTIVIIEYWTTGLADDSSEKIKNLFSTLPYKLVHETDVNLIFAYCGKN